MPMIEIEHLNVWICAGAREVHAVRDVSLALEPGAHLAIIGESGSGKSTLLLAMLGLLPPTAEVSGRLVVDGVDVLQGPEAEFNALRWRRAAMVFQASSNPFSPVRTIGRQLGAVLRFHGSTPVAARGRVEDLLAMVRLPTSVAAAYPHQLSGGMRQRAVIALALACAPKILLADEPTTALDPIVQAEIVELLFSLSAQLGLTLVLVSHDLQLVSHMTGDLAVMQAGEMVACGAVGELMARPTHVHLRDLITALPRFELTEAP
ncbi:ABC transporter ATP-binding protein [Devosia sp.]|uniref:ABC transporter ATP-binding protein n=2 Tax=unclassified Devosia TaxID=196773 RepID=UPI0025C1B874|nr:ABC transporter ATP-binding protein [Devosia sp.]